MLTRKLGLGLLLALVISLFASQAFAGNLIYFNVIVPKLGGSANTGVATKSTTTQQWEVSSIQVGNNYTVSFRPYNNGSAVGSWVSGTTGSYINAPYSPSQPVGANLYLKIKNNISTLVNVQVSGYFFAH